MSRRWLMLNALLVAIAAGFVAYIVWELARPPGTATPPRTRAVPTAPVTPAVPPEAQPPPPGSYAVIAGRNLFSPSRSEAPVTTGLAAPAVAPVKLTLHGVVLRDGVPLAYLEDPVTKRVTSYRVGDSVAGGTVTTIAADHVVVARPDGMVDVRLHDPTKVRPAVASPAAPGPPGATGAPTPSSPGQAPPRAVPGQVLQPPPTSPEFPPGRRRLPPSLLRRGPDVPGAPSDGSNQ